MHYLFLKKFIFILLCIFFIPLQGMQSLKEELTDKVYHLMVPIIDTFQAAKHSLLFITLAQLKQKKHATNYIAQQFAQKEKDIRQDEKNVIQAIANDYNINDEQLQQITSFIKQHKKYQREYLSSAHEEIIQDTTFPQDIIPILKKNNINPQSVLFKNSETSHQENYDAIATQMNVQYSLKNNFLYISKIIDSPTITIFPSFWKVSNISKKGILLHETEHIKEGHGIIAYWLIQCIFLITHTKEEIILNTTNFQQLITIFERQAEILPSLRNSDDAEIIRLGRSMMGYYPGRLSVTHYAQLAEIDELHKLHKKLIHPVRVKKIDDLRVMKKSIDLNS